MTHYVELGLVATISGDLIGNYLWDVSISADPYMLDAVMENKYFMNELKATVPSTGFKDMHWKDINIIPCPTDEDQD